MEAAISPARQTRTQYRHELRALTYVTLDQANGGIVRNLTADGIGVQAVAAIPAQQSVRVRFELRYPRLRIETRGEVMWSTPSGLCGIRFLDLSMETTAQLKEWIFGNLLEGIAPPASPGESIFARNGKRTIQEDGLLLSALPRKVIQLAERSIPTPEERSRELAPESDRVSLDWLSQPLSNRGLAWTVNALVVTAGLLLFAVVFLSVTREAPPWPFATTIGAGCLVAAMYWGFFQMFGGSSLGERLARLATGDVEEQEPTGARFR